LFIAAGSFRSLSILSGELLANGDIFQDRRGRVRQRGRWVIAFLPGKA
jgi:hypothetical protein